MKPGRYSPENVARRQRHDRRVNAMKPGRYSPENLPSARIGEQAVTGPQWKPGRYSPENVLPHVAVCGERCPPQWSRAVTARRTAADA